MKMPQYRSLQLVRGRGGYGFTLSGQAPCSVSCVIEGTTASIIGLKQGDNIISVNGQNVCTASHKRVVKLIGMSTNILNLEIQKNPEETSSSDDDDNAPTSTPIPMTSNKRRLSKDGTSKKLVQHDYFDVKETGIDFNRTEQVINELKSGALFESVISAIDANSQDVDAASKMSKGSKMGSKHRSYDQWSDHSAEQSSSQEPIISHKRNVSAPVERKRKNSFNSNLSNNVFVQSIVAYLGTVEITISHRDDVHHASLMAITACVQQLRREQHIHQRVVMKITQSCVKLYNADGDIIAVYDGRYICFSSACPTDYRFFCIVTTLGSGRVRCHQFMVDPDICAHRNHLEKARRFGIHCSMDTETGNCIEFPQSPRILLKMVEALFSSQENKPNPAPDTVSAPMIHGPETGDVSAASVSTTDSGVDGLNGSAKRIQNQVQHFPTSRIKKKEIIQDPGSKLSAQNLKKHNMKNNNPVPDGMNIYMGNDSLSISSPMNTIGFGKYKSGAGTLPLQKGSSSNKHGFTNSQNRELRQSKRGKKNNKTGEGIFFRAPKRSSSRNLRLNMKNTMSKSSESISVSENGALSGASSIESLASNASLPSCFNGMISGMNQNGRDIFTSGRVPNWAVCFDRLLEDDLGVKYFTEFLRKEFSQENILFWLECKKLRNTPSTDTMVLKEISENIYDRFLSSQATSPVNIDSKGQRLSEEARNKGPSPTMFDQQQNQIYKLMKLDSYSRFLKSPLYRQCIVCEMEGNLLPLEAENVREYPTDTTAVESRHSFSLKHRRFFQRTSSKSQKSQGSNDSIHRDSSDSESGFLEAITNSTRGDDPSLLQLTGADASKICRLTLWDGSSTVLYAAAGHGTIREVLGSLCERRGVPLSSVDVYYQNEDRALALGQDVSVLARQEVRVERRTLFRLDMLPIGRSVGVKAKPTKPIKEVLRPVVAKYGLQLEELITRLNGEKSYLDLSQPVHVLDSLRVCVDQVAASSGQENLEKGTKKSRRKLDAKNKIEKVRPPAISDTEDLISVMSAAQSSKMHDQCGLLSEMNLELPEFLRTDSTSVKHSISKSCSSNNNNELSNSDLLLPPETSSFGVDVPLPKGERLSPNHVATGNAKTRILKMKNMEDLRLSSPVPPPEIRRKKISSADTDVASIEFRDTEADILSAVDDDPFVINKWMQSVSCTPKYPYASDLESTLTSPSSVNGQLNNMDTAISTYVSPSPLPDMTSSDSQSSIANDHKYAKRKVKSILV